MHGQVGLTVSLPAPFILTTFFITLMAWMEDDVYLGQVQSFSPRHEKKITTMWFPSKSDTNRAVQTDKIALDL